MRLILVCLCYNRYFSTPFARWRHFTTTTRILFSFFFFIYIFKFGNPSEVWITNTLLCYIYHLRTRDLRTKVGDTSGVILHRYDGIIISSIYSKKPLFLIKRTPQNGEKGHSHPIRRQNSRPRTGKYIENISDIWKKCIILDLCLFMFEKYICGRGEARIKLLYVCQSITYRLVDVSNWILFHFPSTITSTFWIFAPRLLYQETF